MNSPGSLAANYRHQNLWYPTARTAMLLFLYYVATASAFSGFFAKWSFRDGEARYGIEATLNGTAHRPFIYRQLLPMLANAADGVLPNAVHARINEGLVSLDAIGRQYTRAVGVQPREYVLRYHVMYLLVFASLFSGLLLLRQLAMEMYQSRIVATMAPVIFAPLLTLMTTGGGYYYDYPEVMFMVLAALLAVRGKYALLLITVAFGTLNKESFLLFTLCLFPLLPREDSLKKKSAWIASYVLVAMMVNAIIKWKFHDNLGSTVETHLMANLKAVIRLKSYFATEITFGMLFPRGFNIVYLLLLAVVIKLGWHSVPGLFRRHAYVAALISFPTFMAYGTYNELRNLSFLYLTLFIVLCGALDNWIRQNREHGSTVEP